MIVLICGGRDYNEQQSMREALMKHKEKIETIIAGGARGADTTAEKLADELGIPIRIFPAQWGAYGRAAGHIRNTAMLLDGKPTEVWAFPGGKGTNNMRNQAIKVGVPVRIFER